MGIKRIEESLKTIRNHSTCQKHKVGAIIVNKYGETASIGYNKDITGEKCASLFGGADFSDEEVRAKHREWSPEHEVHAEIMALIKYPDRPDTLQDCTMYVTRKCCDNCIREIRKAGIRKIVYVQL